MSYFKNVNIEQNVATTGATKTNLTALQSYASDWYNSYNQSALQVVAFFDQNVLVYIDQAIDVNGTEIVRTSFYPHYANRGCSRSMASVAPYYRLRLVNQANAVATGDAVIVSTAVFNPLPIDTDHNDSLRVASSKDGYGWEAENTDRGEQRVVTPTRLTGSQMDYEGASGLVDPNFWLTSIANSAVVTVATSLCSLITGTNSAGAASLSSIRRARYVSGFMNRYRANFRIPTNFASNTKRWGIALYSNYTFTITAMGGSNALVDGDIYSNNGQYFTVMRTANNTDTTIYMFGTGAPSTTPLTKVSGQSKAPASITFSAAVAVWVVQDGALFQADGATPTVSCQLFKNGSATSITSFNGELGSSYTLDTNVHTYEIYYSNVKVYFVIDGVLLHTFSASTTGWTSSMHLFIYADNINSGNTTTTTLGMRNSAIHRLGPQLSAPLWKHLTAATLQVLKYGPGALKTLIINTWVNGVTISIYDSLGVAASPISLITLSAPNNPNLTPIVMPFEVDFYNGLTINTTGTTDLTINYE